MLKAIKILKKLPVDFGQYEMRKKTKGKLIAFSFAGNGRGKLALDLGCRDGHWSNQLEALGYEVMAADISPVYGKAIIVNANKNLGFQDGTFDLIWCSEVVEHLENPVFSLEEMRRVLKPDGKLILTTPNSKFWLFRLFDLFKVSIENLQNPEHKHFFSYSRIKNLLPESKIFGFFPYLLLKFQISNPKFIDFLSPTLVVFWQKKHEHIF